MGIRPRVLSLKLTAVSKICFRASERPLSGIWAIYAFDELRLTSLGFSGVEPERQETGLLSRGHCFRSLRVPSIGFNRDGLWSVSASAALSLADRLLMPGFKTIADFRKGQRHSGDGMGEGSGSSAAANRPSNNRWFYALGAWEDATDRSIVQTSVKLRAPPPQGHAPEKFGVIGEVFTTWW